MRKIIYVSLVLFCTVAVFFYINKLLYSPLSKREFKMLFLNYDRNIKKECDIDFIGMSLKGELFDLYLYKSVRGQISSIYPNILGQWENRELSTDVIVSKWKKCPPDSITMERCDIIFSSDNFKKHQCSRSFQSELGDDGNYYTYIYFNELEYYFLLYIPVKEKLYYIRKRGF